MNLTNLTEKKRVFWILQVAGWLLLGMIYMGLYYRNYITDPISMFALFLTYLTGFFSSLLLRSLYRHIHYQSRSIGNLAIIIVVSALLIGNLWFWFDVLLSLPLYPKEWFSESITLQRYMSETYWHTFILGTWSALYFGIKLWIEWTLQKERTQQANTLAQTAQLKMLRYQLNPHFLFNALNSVRALVDENQKQAKEMITELSEFLRYSLISKNFSDVPLKQELEAIRHYLRIEKKRYEENLIIEYQINPLAEEYPVLSFLIHPIVENAIKYGMQTSPMPLQILLKAEVSKQTLALEICNSGYWVEENSEQGMPNQGTGTGLKNIKQRLENAYPGRYFFKIMKTTGNVCVRIEITKEAIKP